MESKTGSRNGEHQQGHGRLAALPNGGLSTSVPTLKNTGMMEPLYRSNQKYVQFSCSCFYEIMGDLCHLLSNSSSCQKRERQFPECCQFSCREEGERGDCLPSELPICIQQADRLKASQPSAHLSVLVSEVSPASHPWVDLQPEGYRSLHQLLRLCTLRQVCHLRCDPIYRLPQLTFRGNAFLHCSFLHLEIQVIPYQQGRTLRYPYGQVHTQVPRIWESEVGGS